MFAATATTVATATTMVATVKTAATATTATTDSRVFVPMLEGKKVYEEQTWLNIWGCT